MSEAQKMRMEASAGPNMRPSDPAHAAETDTDKRSAREELRNLTSNLLCELDKRVSGLTRGWLLHDPLAADRPGAPERQERFLGLMARRLNASRRVEWIRFLDECREPLCGVDERTHQWLLQNPKKTIEKFNFSEGPFLRVEVFSPSSIREFLEECLENTGQVEVFSALLFAVCVFMSESGESIEKREWASKLCVALPDPQDRPLPHSLWRALGQFFISRSENGETISGPFSPSASAVFERYPSIPSEYAQTAAEHVTVLQRLLLSRDFLSDSFSLQEVCLELHNLSNFANWLINWLKNPQGKRLAKSDKTVIEAVCHNFVASVRWARCLLPDSGASPNTSERVESARPSTQGPPHSPVADDRPALSTRDEEATLVSEAPTETGDGDAAEASTEVQTAQSAAEPGAEADATTPSPPAEADAPAVAEASQEPVASSQEEAVPPPPELFPEPWRQRFPDSVEHLATVARLANPLSEGLNRDWKDAGEVISLLLSKMHQCYEDLAPLLSDPNMADDRIDAKMEDWARELYSHLLYLDELLPDAGPPKGPENWKIPHPPKVPKPPRSALRDVRDHLFIFLQACGGYEIHPVKVNDVSSRHEKLTRRFISYPTKAGKVVGIVQRGYVTYPNGREKPFKVVLEPIVQIGE